MGGMELNGGKIFYYASTKGGEKETSRLICAPQRKKGHKKRRLPLGTAGCVLGGSGALCNGGRGKVVGRRKGRVRSSYGGAFGAC